MAHKNSDLNTTFNKALNSHGYSFQYAVVQAAKEACVNRSSDWIFEASEFPVEANGKNTRIDFILHSKDKDHKYCLVAECKRVNPALGHWCFVKAPIVRRNCSVSKFNIEYLMRQNHQDSLKVLTHGEIISVDNFYHIGIAVKNLNAKGDLFGKSDKDAIEKTASQVCLGLNGLIQLGASVKDMVLFRRGFIPVIFTTASLWASDCDLSKTNITDGNIDFSSSSLEEKPWLLYQYHLTSGIKHTVESHQSSKELSSILDFAYIRTIPIVNAKYVSKFLDWLKPHDFFD